MSVKHELTKEQLLDRLGMYELVPASPDEEGAVMLFKNNKVGYYKKVYVEISDEAYDKLATYIYKKTNMYEIGVPKNSSLANFALVQLIISIVASLSLFVVACSIDDPALLVLAPICIISSLVVFFTLRAIADTSTHVKEIYCLLAKKL